MNKLVVASLITCVALAGNAAREIVVKPGSGKGFVAVVNTQTRIAETNFVFAAGAIRDIDPWIFKFYKNASEVKGAGITINIIDDPKKAPLFAAPEAGFAEINVGVLDADLKTAESKEKFLVTRARKMFLRAFAYASGAGGSGYQKNLLDIVQVRDLDYVKEAMPVDAMSAAKRHLRRRGMEPEYAVPYAVACEEGWAPAPANDRQRAIAAKVKAEQSKEPTKGMEIKFDPKKGK